MPYCPDCRQEYESFATSCPDCNVPLVAELEAVASSKDPSLALAILLASNAGVAGLMREDLRQVGIPVGELGEGVLPEDGELAGLLLPQPMFRQVLTVLDRNPKISRTTREIPMPGEDGQERVETIVCYEARKEEDAVEEEIKGSPLLDRPRSELIALGSEVVEELLTLVRRGDQPTREQAVVVLNAMGDVGLAALASMLAVLSRDGREGALFSVLRMIRERIEDPALLSDLLDVAGDSSLKARPRALALHALGRSGLPPVYERILPLLDDPDHFIREEADEALCTLADEDMGFDPDMRAEERAKVRERWRIWFLDAAGRGV
ncbi:MAG: hypothetical protein V2A76_18445 [Planctomycetota bacterium]